MSAGSDALTAASGDGLSQLRFQSVGQTTCCANWRAARPASGSPSSAGWGNSRSPRIRGREDGHEGASKEVGCPVSLFSVPFPAAKRLLEDKNCLPRVSLSLPSSSQLFLLLLQKGNGYIQSWLRPERSPSSCSPQTMPHASVAGGVLYYLLSNQTVRGGKA